MKSIQDAIYNWLTIKVVSDARPEDFAARETEEMFLGILKEKYGMKDIEVVKDEDFYYVIYFQNDQKKQNRFLRELIEVMIDQIQESPEKFKNYPE